LAGRTVPAQPHCAPEGNQPEGDSSGDSAQLKLGLAPGTYPDTVRFLYSLGNEIRTAKLGLERVGALAERLGHPERAFRVIHVAGTNGKGSVCAMVASALDAAGIRTGLYTSPHLLEPTERIQVGGEPISEELFLETFERVHRSAEQMTEDGSLESHPTYFETVTLMGFLAFRELGIDTAVVEVGLGGRLDATNIVTPAITAITSIDYDHESFLGNSLDGIAREKAGILKPGVPAVFSRQQPEVQRVLAERAAEVAAPWFSTVDWRTEELTLTPTGSSFVARRSDETLLVECPLAGEHQVENALTAALILKSIGVDAGTITDGIRRTRWSGRLERVSEKPEIFLDGAHNPGGVRALMSYIRRFFHGRKVWIVYGTMRDKSLDEIADLVSSVADRIVITTPASHRALRQQAIERFFDHPEVVVAGGIEEALAQLREAKPDDVAFVTGSLMLVGEAKRLLSSERCSDV